MMIRLKQFLFIYTAVLAGLMNPAFSQTVKRTIPAGYTEGSNGLLYKIDRKTKSGNKPALSDVLTLNLNYALRKAKGDSLLFDSRQIPQKELMVQLVQPSYRGDLMEGLALLEVGDSISFITRADSFFIRTAGLPQLPADIPPGSELLFHVGLTKSSTLFQLQAEQLKADSIAREEEGSRIAQYLKEKKITQSPSASGLIIVPGKKGKGIKPTKGQKVKVHYTGTLLNGTKFDSSVDRGQPFEFVLGQGQVIRGWDEGIAELEIGSTATLIIPSAIGYGATGSGGSIPPYSPLVFEVELLNAE